MTVLNFSFGFFRFILACKSGCPWLFHVTIAMNNHRSFLTFNTLIKQLSQKLCTVITNSKSKTSSNDNLLTTDTVLMPQSMLITRPISNYLHPPTHPSFHTFSASRVFHKLGMGYKRGAQDVHYYRKMTLRFHTVLIPQRLS